MDETPATHGRIFYCFDIDGTICTNTEGAYEDAEPHPDRIAHVNMLYRQGHHITLFTARGTTTGRDWRGKTEAQLESWGVLYHSLQFGKPFADIFVDDKAIHSETYSWGGSGASDERFDAQVPPDD